MAALSVTPIFNPPVALLAGIILSQTLGHPFSKINKKAVPFLLQISIIGLGFGINLYQAAAVGREGFWITIMSISVTLLVGWAASTWLSLNKNVSFLISAGTAICGGSAIAAVSPLVDASEEEMSISLGTIFILNAIALFIFPPIGHFLNLSQEQFGLWSAIAIHDTSSVVGASQTFGAQALQIATTVKLSRALWIVPLSLITAVALKKSKPTKFPYFILLFIIAMVINTFIIEVHSFGNTVVEIAKKGMTLTLFLIGAGLSRSSIKTVGTKPLVLGIGLWIIIAVGSLIFILYASN